MSFDIPLHTIPPARLLPDTLTVLRVLRFAEGPHSHVLKNALIDHQAIERKASKGRYTPSSCCVRARLLHGAPGRACATHGRGGVVACQALHRPPFLWHCGS